MLSSTDRSETVFSATMATSPLEVQDEEVAASHNDGDTIIKITNNKETRKCLMRDHSARGTRATRRKTQLG